MSNLTFEIICEEIPARFMPGLLEELKKKAEERFFRERLTFTKVETFGTYRRLVLLVEELSPKQSDLINEARGPAAEIAFDASGKPTPAAFGFAKSQQVSVEGLITKQVNGKNYVFAKVVRKGRPTGKVLSIILPEIITALYLPVSMRWGNLDFKFIRPIQAFTAIFGTKIIRFKLAGLLSSNKKTLKNPGVIVDQNRRKALIKQLVEAAAKRTKGTALISEDLLDEVTFLVENPIAYAGKFKPEFLALPQEVLITSMKKNQKYFPVVDGTKKLQAKFVVVTDGCKNPKVVEGNQNVLSARLSDARFFFEEDKKTPLKARVPGLANIAFLEKLGNLLQKSERIKKLVEWLGKRLKLDAPGIKTCQRIAELCKTDLNTKMVFEFPELQGVMGREYALLSGESPQVAQGIYEHYLPRFAEDNLPSSLEGITVAIADRLDTLVGAFSIGYAPTGSEDPYGLRRAVMGIIRIVYEKKLDLMLDEAIEHTFKQYDPSEKNLPSTKKTILEFFVGRLRPLLLEKGVRYDAADAALYDFNDILDVFEKAKSLNSLINENWFPGIVASADRLSRIAGNAPREQVLEHDLVEKEEKELYELYLKINWEVNEKIKRELWAEATRELSKLTGPIELFFDKVLVMHQDERIKLNRLALLKTLEKLYLSVADFRKIVVEGNK